MSFELAKTICYLLTGGFLVFLAVTITRDNFANRLNRATGAMLFFAGLGPIFMGLAAISHQSLSGNLEGSTLFGLRHLWELFFPSLLYFVWLFPADVTSGSRISRLRWLVFLPQIMHVVIVLFFADIVSGLDVFSGGPERTGLTALIVTPLARFFSWLRLLIGALHGYEEIVFGAINLLYVFIAIFFLETSARRVTNPRLQTQTRWVQWGIRGSMLVFVVVQIAAFFPRGGLSQGLSSSLLIAGMLFGAAMLVVATIRHQFLDVQMVFKQSFVTTITSAALVGLYVLAVVRAERILTPMFGDQAEMVSYGFIILILLFFQPINNWIDNGVKAMFMRVRTDHRNVIERFSRQVISSFDPKQLRKVIEETLKTALLVDQVYFDLYDDEIKEYTILPSDRYPRRIVTDREDLMLRGINLLEAPTYYHSLSEYRAGSELAAILESRGVRMILPLKDADHMLGFVALTGKAAGYRYSSEDFNLLGVLSNQMVSALTNARLYVESLERLRLQEEINMARQIQVDLLPSEPPRTPCSEISHLYPVTYGWRRLL